MLSEIFLTPGTTSLSEFSISHLFSFLGASHCLVIAQLESKLEKKKLGGCSSGNALRVFDGMLH
jgi:hypothetical protein